jgi:hypothetical protein
MKEHVYAVSPRTMEDTVTKFEVVVTNERYQKVEACSKQCRASHCRLLEMDGGRFKHKLL